MVLTDVVIVVDDGIAELTSSPSEDVGVVVIRSSTIILDGLGGGCSDVVVKKGEEPLDDKILIVDDEVVVEECVFAFVIPPMLDDILVHPWTFVVIDDKEEMIQRNETNNIFCF